MQQTKKRRKKEMRNSKKYNEAPICTHCGKKHPAKKED
jgi:hypothetical protein